MKKKRLEKILEIVSENEIETQDELIAHLRRAGFDVTQATISRDIRELNLTKIMHGQGKYRYVTARREDGIRVLNINHALADAILRAEYAQNMVVVHTYPGMAQAIALEVDNLGHAPILGTVAGDDTILIVTRDIDSAATVSGLIKDMIRARHKGEAGTASAGEGH